jgi:glyoxylase-like metal-dependent hydrolase (beta-lactamase superfamily II)
MREVVDGVIAIPIGYVNAFAVVVDDGVVLVDTGIPGRADKITSVIEEAQRRIGEVHTILLTHWHPDHVGGVAELCRRSRRPNCGPGDRCTGDLSRGTPSDKGFHARCGGHHAGAGAGSGGRDADRRRPHFGAGLHRLPHPGHTAGHASFLLDRGGGVLFAGDAVIRGRTGRIRRSPRMVTEDRAAETASISRLADLTFDAATFGHGRAITHDAAHRFRSSSHAASGSARCSIAGRDAREPKTVRGRMHSWLLFRFVASLSPPAARSRPRRRLVGNRWRNISSTCWIARRVTSTTADSLPSWQPSRRWMLPGGSTFWS